MGSGPGLAALRVPGLDTLASFTPAAAPARVGHLALAIARSWSNAVTASAGMVLVIGGPLATGRRHAIDHVLRTSAPMHDGFAGGAFVDTSGALLGVTTAAAIRGLGVVIPASIAWQTVAGILQHGGLKRGYLGISGQTARLAPHQRDAIGRDEALVVVGVPSGSPSDAAGVLVGDVLFQLDEGAYRIARTTARRARRGNVSVGRRPSGPAGGWGDGVRRHGW